MSNAKLILNEQEYELPVVVGTEGEVGVDITKLRNASGAITLDPGYGNTGSCESAITFINGEEGILRYRGYPIEQLTEQSDFAEVSYLTIYGELPTQSELERFRNKIKENSDVPDGIKQLLKDYPNQIHPMAVLGSMITSLSGFYDTGMDHVDENIIRLIGQTKTISADIYRALHDLDFVEPDGDLSYSADFLHMMFGKPVSEVQERALRLLLILHVDHEQNCSASTVRMVGSSLVNIFAAMGAGVAALWGPLHGGANQRVIEMLEAIRDDGGDYKKYIELAKDKNSNFRLMGFGHRVYKNFDPRARIIKKSADEVLEELGVDDPLLDIAKNLEEATLQDSYFAERKLYPNVDFYSGIIYRAMGIPTNMFTVMFALGRMPGWIAQWREMRGEPNKIARPRQIYTGAQERNYVGIEQR